MRIKILICALLTISSRAYSLTNQARDDENSIFCKLQNCAKQGLSYHLNYTLPIENLTDSQPDGYVVRLSFYRFGFGDSNIILAEDYSINWSNHSAYKIDIQTSTGYDKEPHINIRKLIDNEDESVDVLLATEKIKFNENFKSFPILQVLIEVTKVGHINVYFNNDPKPLVAAYDIRVVKVKDVSFAANDALSLYYDCPSDASDLPKQASTSSLVPLENLDLSSANPDILAANCRWYETWNSDDDKVIYKRIKRIEDSQPDGYWLRLPLYMIYDSYVRILLLNSENDNQLTIEIDALVQTIRVRDSYDNVIGSVQFAQSSKQTKLEIRIPENKPIEIYFGYFTDKPILTVETDREPNFLHLGFASINSRRALFFYECSDRNTVLPQHKLLIDGIISSGNDPYKVRGSNVFTHRVGVMSKEKRHLKEGFIKTETNKLRQNCTSIQLNNVTYPKYIKLSTIQKILPNDFIVRIPFYVQGSRDVYILLSESVWSKHNSYEIVIGTVKSQILFRENVVISSTERRNILRGDEPIKLVVESQILIRKNNVVISSTKRRNILRGDKPIKLVVEITRAGQIRVFTEYNTSKPILEALDPDLIKTLQFISFNGRDRSTEFLINCNH